MLQLIKQFWDRAVFVCQAEGNFGKPFKAQRGVTQGGPLSPKLFITLVDAVVWECIYRLNGKWGVIEGLRWAVDAFVSIFYDNDALVALRHLALLQMALNVLAELFGHVGLLTNTKKMQTIFRIACITVGRRAITPIRIGPSNM